MKRKGRIRSKATVAFSVTVLTLCTWFAALASADEGKKDSKGNSASYVVFGCNDLGMHCMNEDFSELCILPPANTLHAQVIKRGEEPDIVRSGVTVQYSIPGNTKSSNKTNFWQYAQALFGVNLPNDVGLSGSKMSGNMSPTGSGDYWAKWIPITPKKDNGTIDPFQLGLVKVVKSGKVVASTQPVVPVSWEISCNLCHIPEGGESVANNILRKHDMFHGTDLVHQKPVLCQKCHADPAIGAPGVPGIPNLSSAMHTSHAPRMGMSGLQNTCYACHPGVTTQCQRDIHKSKGIECVACHTSMEAVGNPNRTPWVDEPKCGSCHHVAGHQYEEPGKLMRDSRGHGGVFCESCHGAPHATTPTITPQDNVQAIQKQGFAGTIRKCTVCHTKTPSEPFFHKIDD